MAEYSSEEKINTDIEGTGFSDTDVMTGGGQKERYLLYQLLMCMNRAQSIDIIVSFLMESGVKMILSGLEKALERGARVRILTGNYLGITQPQALWLLKKGLKGRADIRFYNEKNRSFHPKSYIFHYESYSDIFIGSSNVSKSALTSGIEWNYRFNSREAPEDFNKFYETFEDLFENHSIIIDDRVLRDYSRNWHMPALEKDMEKYDSESIRKESESRPFYEPRGAQIEALYALEESRAEGADKGLVQAATGVGKTCLAAFDSKNFKTVLFVAHRREILIQAAQTFKNVRETDDYGFFDGEEKCTDKPLIFASAATLGRQEYLNDKYFKKDYFDYIVIDEFHHAVTANYKRITDYFKPQFLLGLTATPDRMDGKNIYELCDYNVPYEISLKDAINRGILVPFRYYGIYDDTDYSGLHLVRGRYDDKELNETYIGNVRRHDLIFKNYCKYGSGRALGFCCSRAHAEEMAEEFNRRGVCAAAVCSSPEGEFSEDRAEAVRKLKAGQIKVIFCVDMFNEGVDIPQLEMVMFLRPTQSPVVFLQQLGRGLRKAPGKEYLTVLDFIGNYEKAGNVRFLLTGEGHTADQDMASGERKASGYEKGLFPDGCQVDFDLRLIDLFSQMEKGRMTIKDRIRQEFFRVRDTLGRRPSRLELFTYMDDEVYAMCISHSGDNIFKNYLEFLHNEKALTPEEEKLYGGPGREFLHLLETTSMTKVYKMPVLQAFYNHGSVRMAVTEEELLASWKEFFSRGTNWKDLKAEGTYEDYKRISDKEHLKNIMDNPVHFLIRSGKGFFTRKEGYAIALSADLEEPAKEPAFAEQMGDIIEYRTMDYYRRRYRKKR